jgi:hypothetical protein
MTIHRPSAVVAGALAAAAVLLYLFDPATTAAYPSCPFRALTGLLCPLCGGLRAAHALVHGRVVDAVLLNPFVFAAAVMGPLVPLRWVAAVGIVFALARNLA